MREKRVLQISTKHGVNPTILVCAYCGQDTDIALCEQLPGDVKAPLRSRQNSPCEECRKHMKEGIMLIHAAPGKEKGETIIYGYLVVTEEGAKHLFSQEYLPRLLAARACYIGSEQWVESGLAEISEELANAKAGIEPQAEEE